MKNKTLTAITALLALQSLNTALHTTNTATRLLAVTALASAIYAITRLQKADNNA